MSELDDQIREAIWTVAPVEINQHDYIVERVRNLISAQRLAAVEEFAEKLKAEATYMTAKEVMFSGDVVGVKDINDALAALENNHE